MWKIAVAFAIFAAISLYMIMQFGDQVDMSGEKHGADAVHAPTPAEAKVSRPEGPKHPIRERLALIQIQFSGLWCLIRNKSARSALLFFENWE